MGLGMDVAAGAANAATGGIIGSIFGGINDRRQRKQAQKLQDMQIKGQKEMAIFNREQGMQMWHDTNYAAQAEEARKAGMSIGMLYGGSGGGGTTANVASGNVSGQSAPVGGGEIGMGIQSALTAAQIRLMEAQTNKTNVETAKTAGADTANVTADTAVKSQTLENLKQNVASEKAKQGLTEIQTELTGIQTKIAHMTTEAAIQTIGAAANKMTGEAQSAMAKGEVDSKTTNEAMEIVKTDLKGMVLDNMLKDAGLKEISTKIEKLKAEIRQGDTKNAIEKFKAEIQAEYPAVWSTAGKVLNDGLMVIEQIGGHTNMGRKVK